MYEGYVVRSLILPQGSYRPGDSIELSTQTDQHRSLVSKLRSSGVVRDLTDADRSRRGAERGVGV